MSLLFYLAAAIALFCTLMARKATVRRHALCGGPRP